MAVGGVRTYNSAAYYQTIERKFDFLDAWTRRNHAGYKDRTWGIASLSLYETAKTKFIFDTIGKASASINTPLVICELGFNAGHSAVLFLETLPFAKVYSFDLGDVIWSGQNKDLLKEIYGARFEYIVGDSVNTMPEFIGVLECDIAFADGQKDYEKRYLDMLSFSRLSKKGALIFLDEISDENCAMGKVPEAQCAPTHYYEETKAYNRLVHDGIIAVDSCITTKTPSDGFCVARFL